MRMTLTLDDDVADEIERLCRDGDVTRKEVVNRALRYGLRDMAKAAKKRRPFRTQTHAMGPPFFDIDNVAEALAHAEGEGDK